MATVLITGGHAGIGLECARQLAARGFKIILAGRSPATMQSVAEELRAVRDIDVATVELDLSSLEEWGDEPARPDRIPARPAIDTRVEEQV